jgi:hypothetical protein
VGLARGKREPDAQAIVIEVDPRPLARFGRKNGLGQWRVAAGSYRIALGKSASE